MNIGDSEVINEVKHKRAYYCQQLVHTMIGFIKNGTKRIYEKDGYVEVAAGQLFMLRRGVYFIEDIPGVSGFEHTVFCISSQDIYRNIERLSMLGRVDIVAVGCKTAQSIYVSESNRYLDMIFSIDFVQNNTDEIISNIVQSCIDMLVTSILLDSTSPFRSALVSGINIDDNIFQSILLSSILDRDCTLDHLARKTNSSRTAFKSKFARIYATTPHKWIMEHRLRLSIPLLLATDEPISEVACRCGFITTSHYIQLFKGMFKITPKEYRKSRLVSRVNMK